LNPGIAILAAGDTNVPPFERRNEPITLGVAFPRGAANTPEDFALVDARGLEQRVQSAVLDRWGDGSIRWLLLDFQANVPSGGVATYELLPRRGTGPEPPAPWLHAERTNDGLVVRTGAAIFRLDQGRSLFGRVSSGNVEEFSLIEPEQSGVLAEDASGRRHALQISHSTIEREGPLRAVVRLDGWLGPTRGRPLVKVMMRLHFFGGLGSVRVELSVTNPQRAHHPHGCWDLGDRGSIYLRDLSVLLGPIEAASTVKCSLEPSEPFRLVKSPLEIYQDSSGGENWRSINHCNHRGEVMTTIRGYRMLAGSDEHRGLRATPVVSIGGGAAQLTIAVPQFWQNFQKALEVRDGVTALRLFPRQYADLHEIQGGERKTQTFTVCFGPDTVSDDPLQWSRLPLAASASPSSYLSAGVWARLRAGSEQARTGYEELVNAAVEGPAAFVTKRERIDEYGWRHFGDIYGDHEAVRQPGLISHYNNQYDALAGFATRFCQTGDRRWWSAMDELAAHVADIDIYHCVDDRAAYNGGLFWHTNHYLPAHTATHRSYSRRTRTPGGGPSDEHNYTTGLMLHYFLTGSECSRDAVLELAQWVLDMDDGTKARFWWLDREETGLASATHEVDYHGPGRGAANSIDALLNAHRLSGERRYLEKADQLVARCVHPCDIPQDRNLLDAEARWSYTVFLQNLGKYLEYRAERGLIDPAYQYGRAALLRYAGWMAEHEEPYLNHAERLEFPNETWPAQDLRKAAVFEYAACHADSAELRERFQRRANDFVDYSVSTLQAMATKSLTRPVVLLLAYGFQRPRVSESDLPAPAVQRDFIPPVRFMPYRRRVLRKLVLLAAVAGGAGLAMALLLGRRGWPTV
jgi:hypothetical protein